MKTRRGTVAVLLMGVASSGVLCALRGGASVLPLAQAAGGPPAKPPPPPPSSSLKGTLKGFVENEKGKPVEGCEISIEFTGRPPIRAVTDAKGEFTMVGVPTGPVTIQLRAKGCFPQEQTVTVAGKGSTSLSATLKLGVRYAGRVLDPKGAPVDGARVRAVRLVGGGDTLTWDDLSSFGSSTSKPAKTDKDGKFALDGLEPGKRYVLRVKHPHFQKSELRGLPSKGGTSKEDIEVKLEDAAWISGTVTDDAGKPVVGAKIGGDPDFPAAKRGFVLDLPSSEDDPAASEECRTDASGKFVLGGLTDAHADVSVDAKGFFFVTAPVEDLKAGEEHPTLDFKLERATATLEGTVVDAKGLPILSDTSFVTVDGDNGSTSGWTDKAAHFKFVGLRTRGVLSVTASCSEFAEATANNVKPGAKNFRITLQRAPRLSVKVTDAAGTLIPKATVASKLEDAPTGDESDAEASARRRFGSASRYFELEQPDAGYDIAIPIGTVRVTFQAEGYEDLTVGPYVTKVAGKTDGGTVVMKKLVR